VQTVFVTGAEGFAGTYVFDHLRQTGYEAVAGVRNRARKLAYERQNCKAIVCDVTDAINVGRAIASVRPSAVIHLAGLSRPEEAAADPLLGYQSIVTAWANVLDAVRRTVPRARIVMASACDVYGDAGREGRPVNEASASHPITTFGSLKRTAESIAHTFYRDYHLNVTIARPFHYLGARQPERFFFGAVARRLANCAARGGGNRLSLPDLSCRRDLLHVQDVATAYERLLTDGRPNETYNICSGQAVTCREVVELMAAEFGLEIELAEDPPAVDAPRIALVCGDSSKLRSELRWQPTHSLAEAVRDLAESCRAAQPALAR
jgi:GDP-4-dehydro-6-deoxy-D-mannose reductase